jgi:hypothetical protein
MLLIFCRRYTYGMALAIAKSGRPCFVAVINFETDSELELRDKFYNVCVTFHYREVMALSRAFGVNPDTVECWKYKVQFPNWYIALQVIDWDERGRPMKQVPPWQSAADMF